jgi:hypothetical protein
MLKLLYEGIAGHFGSYGEGVRYALEYRPGRIY